MPKRSKSSSKQNRRTDRSSDNHAGSHTNSPGSLRKIVFVALVLGGICYIALRLFAAFVPQEGTPDLATTPDLSVNLQNVPASELEILLDLPATNEIGPTIIDIDVWTDLVDREVSAMIGDDPQDSQVVHLAGLVDLRLKRSKLAEPKLRLAVELDPNNLDIRMDLAELLIQLGRDDEAVEVLSPSVSASAKEADYLGLLGECQQRVGQLIEAERSLALASELVFEDSRKQALACQKLAKVQLQLQKFEAAEKSVLRACDLNPGDSESWLVLSSVLRLQRQPDRAGRALQRWNELNEQQAASAPAPAPADRDLTVEHSISMSRVFASIFRSMAVVYQDKGKLEKSQTCFEQSLGIDPNDYQSLAGLAALHRKEGNFVKAVEANRKLLQIQPSENAHYQNLANLAMEMRRPDVAEAVLRLACLRMPDNGTSHLTLARLLLLLKKYTEALHAAKLAHDKLSNAETAELLETVRHKIN